MSATTPMVMESWLPWPWPDVFMDTTVFKNRLRDVGFLVIILFTFETTISYNSTKIIIVPGCY